MKTIMIVCAGGATSGLMAQYVVKSAKEQNLDAALLFPEDVKLKADFFQKNKDRDVVFFMGPVTAITSAHFRDFKEQVDAVLVAPQVSYMYKEVEKVLGEIGIPSAKIDSLAFGRMEGAKILEQALRLTGEI
ncbi:MULTISPECIES: PTS sugar transporter subunit IIB [Listeria]|uniref:PTS sugar transporter subunit IIB n=1 Tax=Listeria TaxID=1637 RepID=UPI000B58C579|nr:MULTISPECIES: PTS lactose transporter subunit IIBC [Listeria]